jgi:hypothetical protein
MTASPDQVVSGLIEKRRELARIIDKLQRQLDQHRADLTHIDGVLRVLATDLDPETIRPKRVYRRNRDPRRASSMLSKVKTEARFERTL